MNGIICFHLWLFLRDENKQKSTNSSGSENSLYFFKRRTKSSGDSCWSPTDYYNFFNETFLSWESDNLNCLNPENVKTNSCPKRFSMNATKAFFVLISFCIRLLSPHHNKLMTCQKWKLHYLSYFHSWKLSGKKITEIFIS